MTASDPALHHHAARAARPHTPRPRGEEVIMIMMIMTMMMMIPRSLENAREKLEDLSRQMHDEVSETENIRKNLSIERMIIEVRIIIMMMMMICNDDDY